MGKITPRLKSILVIIVFLGFTNFILSGTRVNFSEIIFSKILPEKFNSLLSPDVLPQADAPLEQRAKILPVEIFESAGIRSSFKSAESPEITNTSITNATCAGNNDGAIDISVSGGTEPYTYLWSTGQTTEDITGVPPGNYTVTVTDSVGVSITSATIEIKVEDKINPVAIAKNITVQLDAGGQVTIDATDVDNGSSDACGIASMTLSKDSFDCTNVGPNTVTLTVTDNNGNVSEETTTVTVEDNTAPVVNTKNITVQLNAGGQATISPEDVDNNSSDACGITSMSVTPNSFDCSNVGPNTVTLTVTDNNGNVDTETATVNVEDKIAPVVNTKNITVQLDANGTVSIPQDAVNDNSTDSCGGLTFSTNITSFDCDDVGNNTVELTVTDGNGNSASKIATVTVEDNIIPVISSISDINKTTDNGLCTALINITVPTVNDNCTVTTPTGSRSDNKPLNDPFPTGETIITWTATDANGNNAAPVIQKVIVKDNEAPVPPQLTDITRGCTYTVEVPIATDNCDNAITATASRPTTFDASGEITWTFRDSAGNISTSKQIITINPISVAIQKQDIVCFDAANGTSEALVTGGVGPFTYDWGSAGSTSKVENLIPGTYSVIVTDANGCNASAQVTITQPDLLQADYTSTNVTCSGNQDGSITIANPMGGFGNYEYSINGTSWQQSSTFSNLNGGTYSVQIRDAQITGCVVILDSSLVIEEPQELQMTEATSTPTTCFGASDGTVTAGTVSGGNGEYQYSIDNTNFSSSNTFAGLPSGTHTIFVKDSKGCSLQKTVTVMEPPILNATVARTNVSCFDGNDGKITITNPTGGSGTFEYSVDGTIWQASGNFAGLTSGEYDVYIRNKDAVSCMIILKENYQLTQPAAALSAEVITTRTTTYGTSTGSATANPTGGTPGYTYEWRKAGEPNILQTTKTATGLLAGDYELTIRDIKGCSIQKLFTIIDAMEAFIISRNLCEGDEFTIRTSYFEVENGKARGGVGPYTYKWDFGSEAVDPLRPGVGEHKVLYNDIGNKVITLIVTDSTGEVYTTTQQQYIGKCYEPCGKSENIEFNPNDIFVGDSAGTRLDLENNCNDNVPKYIYLAVSKSANAYNPYVEIVYVVKNTLGTEDTVTTTFVTGCRLGADIDDYSPEGNKTNKVGDFVRFTLAPIEFKCGDVLEIENFYITWTNVSKKTCGQNNNAFCYSTADPVTLPTQLKAEATATPILCKGDNSGMISVKASGGFAPYAYSLTGNTNNYSTNNQFINLPAGNYTVYVRDARENKTTVNVTVIEPTTSVSATTSTAAPICYGKTGEATVIATGGTPFETEEGYEYLWNDAAEQTTATAFGLPAGNYTVTVIDANGCQILKEVTITEPEQLSVAEAGDDQTFNCGFNTTFLNANTPDTGVGTWTIEGGTGGEIIAVNDPNSKFQGNADTYILRWTIAHPDGTCSTSDEVQITFVEDCSKLDFDGVDDHIVFGNNYGLSSGTFSVEAWVKLKSTNGVKTILSKKNMRNPGDGGFDLVINQGAPTFRWGNNTVSSSSQLGTQRWYHIAVIFKDSRVNLYVDGIRVGNAAATNPAASSFPFLIGAAYDINNPEIPQNYFHGWIEEVRIWKTALSEEQLRFMMNQRLKVEVTPVKGEVLPMIVPGKLDWTSLDGYYPLLANEGTNGITQDKATIKVDGNLKNITTLQKNTAPLPYEADIVGPWKSHTTWDLNSGNEELKKWWTYPNDVGINGDPILWNIARINKDITSGGHDINVLGLLSNGGTFTVSNPSLDQDWQNPGQALRVSHYLKLNGNIILVGESQLVQTDVKTAAQITDPTKEFPQSITSVLDEASTGYIERAQQGTANSYNYNYWSSPVSLQGAANNSTYTIGQVMLDGSPTTNYGKILSFDPWHEFADWDYATPRKISSYWLHKFRGSANVYSEWVHIGSTGTLLAGEGYTMKGTSGNAAIADRQNYVFKGKPNNGTIGLTIGTNQNYLLGNPYPSAIDVNAFILENLKDVTGGKNTQNVFNGAVYFWDHFAGKSHILLEYIGGYATRNLLDGVPAISNDQRIYANDAQSNKIPGRYIPVAQGFFINTTLDSEIAGNISIHGGEVKFKNSQRAFVRESTGNTGSSLFLRPEENSKTTEKTDDRSKIRLDFRSPMKFNRQILVGVDSNTTDGFDLGYDAPLNDNAPEDMFWMIGSREFVIQGVPDFNLDRVLPIGLYIQKEGDISISINKLENIDDDVNIYLFDKVNDSYFDLRGGDFEMEIDPGQYLDRFALVFEDKTELELPDESEEEEEEEEEQSSNPGTTKPEPTLPEMVVGIGDPNVFYMDNSRELVVENPEQQLITKITLHSLSGQIIEEYTNLGTQKEIKLPVRSYSSSVYVVKMFTEKGIIYKKMIINN